MQLWERKGKQKRWGRVGRGDERKKAGEVGEWEMTRRQTLGGCPSCWDLREPVSLATMPAGGQRQANTEDRGEGMTGKETSKSHRDLAGGGRGG